MSAELVNEVEAINAIYGNNTIRATEADTVYILSIPQHEAALRIDFPSTYPNLPPNILGIESTGESTRKGYGTHVATLASETLRALFEPGAVSLFDLLEELDAALRAEKPIEDTKPPKNVPEQVISNQAPQPLLHLGLENPPLWTVSAPVTEKRSTFVARACHVTSTVQARAFISYLLDTDKRAAKATHNISAYRIRSLSDTEMTETPIIFQDCDDDGETAAGGRLLHLLRVMDVWNVLVIVSRWYGGIKLGPDRFSIINNVAREAIVEGGWTKSRIRND